MRSQPITLFVSHQHEPGSDYVDYVAVGSYGSGRQLTQEVRNSSRVDFGDSTTYGTFLTSNPTVNASDPCPVPRQAVSLCVSIADFFEDYGRRI